MKKRNHMSDLERERFDEEVASNRLAMTKQKTRVELRGVFVDKGKEAAAKELVRRKGY